MLRKSGRVVHPYDPRVYDSPLVDTAVDFVAVEGQTFPWAVASARQGQRSDCTTCNVAESDTVVVELVVVVPLVVDELLEQEGCVVPDGWDRMKDV
jgi:hypothetical protein